jgi:hypothetical protein
MNRTFIGILKESNQECLSSLLKRKQGSALPAIWWFYLANMRKASIPTRQILHDLTNQTLKWFLPDQQFRSLLVPADLTKGNCTRPITMGLLDAWDS